MPLIIVKEIARNLTVSKVKPEPAWPMLLMAKICEAFPKRFSSPYLTVSNGIKSNWIVALKIEAAFCWKSQIQTKFLKRILNQYYYDACVNLEVKPVTNSKILQFFRKRSRIYSHRRISLEKSFPSWGNFPREAETKFKSTFDIGRWLKYHIDSKLMVYGSNFGV